MISISLKAYGWNILRVGAAAWILGGIGCASNHSATSSVAEPASPTTETAPLSGDVEANESLRQPVEVFADAEAKATVAVTAGPTAEPTIAATQPGEATFQQHTSVEEGYDSDVAVDPSGKWLVFASTRDSEHADIFLQQVDGTAVVQLTNENADAAHPVFSPDGKRIAFGSTRSGSWQIYLMDTDGRNVAQVTQGPMQAVHPSFSPDGTRIVYAGLAARSGQWELWTANLNTKEKRQIGYGLSPRWSPEKTVDRIAFQRPRKRGSRLFSLWTLELDDGEPRHVTEVVVSGSAAVLSPSWSPDGRKLAFATITEPVRGESRKKLCNDIWIADADGSNRKRLTDGVGASLTPFWSGDGRVYFISDRGGAECVWSVHVDTESTLAKGAKQDAKQDRTLVGAPGGNDFAD